MSHRGTLWEGLGSNTLCSKISNRWIPYYPTTSQTGILLAVVRISGLSLEINYH